MRSRSIDLTRGLATLLMIYGHMLQFFGAPDVFPIESALMHAINLVAFPTFLFCFGQTTRLAYFSKPFRQVWPRMLRTFLRILGAYDLSGLAFRLLREHKPFGPGTVRRVLLLQDIPGWSEFLIAFALTLLLAAALFPLLKRAGGRLWVLLPAIALAIGLTCLPTERITIPQLCLWIGGTGYAYFPVLIYFPYFLAGAVIESRRDRLIASGCAVLLSAVAAFWTARHGLPGRFPPHAMWLPLPAAGVALLSALGELLTRLPERAVRLLHGSLGRIGAQSLYYLLASNLALFTCAGGGIVPQLSRKGFWPFNLPIQSPAGALVWSGVLIACIALTVGLAGRGKAQRAAK